mmetsp:Transcript_7766/g.12944  ORF Transcript_7766/g.12944 Transcript_7766/m.12944 type:complete len:222 (-) Transcript_7766:118-783(-)
MRPQMLVSSQLESLPRSLTDSIPPSSAATIIEIYRKWVTKVRSVIAAGTPPTCANTVPIAMRMETIVSTFTVSTFTTRNALDLCWICAAPSEKRERTVPSKLYKLTLVPTWTMRVVPKQPLTTDTLLRLAMRIVSTFSAWPMAETVTTSSWTPFVRKWSRFAKKSTPFRASGLRHLTMPRHVINWHRNATGKTRRRRWRRKPMWTLRATMIQTAAIISPAR